jgi:hypothetical protein
MLIPETIGTIAALLSFIEFMLRMANSYSPMEKRALREAQAKIKSLQPTAPVTHAKAIFSDAIHKHVPEPEVEIAEEDLSLGLEALRLYKIGLGSAEQKTLPTYGKGLGFLYRFAGDKLIDWNCFEAWGTKLLSNIPQEDGFRTEYIFLPMLHTEKVIKRTQAIVAKIPKQHRSGRWYCGGCRINSLPCTLTQLALTQGKYVANEYYQTLQMCSLNFHDYEFELSFPKGFINFEKNQITITAKDSENLAAGLLNDLIDYSRRVRGEIHRSESVKSRLSGLLKR